MRCGPRLGAVNQGLGEKEYVLCLHSWLLNIMGITIEPTNLLGHRTQKVGLMAFQKFDFMEANQWPIIVLLIV